MIYEHRIVEVEAKEKIGVIVDKLNALGMEGFKIVNTFMIQVGDATQIVGQKPRIRVLIRYVMMKEVDGK